MLDAKFVAAFIVIENNLICAKRKQFFYKSLIYVILFSSNR